MPELAGAHPALPGEAGGPAALPVEPAGPVVGGGRHRVLPGPRGDIQADAHAGDRLGRLKAGPAQVRRDAEPGQVRRGPGQVVGVVDADAQGDQPPGGRGNQPQLAAGVQGAEPPVGLRGEAELGVVGGGLLDVRHADGDRQQPVQAHGCLPVLCCPHGNPG